MEFYKKEIKNDILVKAIDKQNNYSLASQNDPELEGYINHMWENDISKWIKISGEEVEEILGYNPENF